MDRKTILKILVATVVVVATAGVSFSKPKRPAPPSKPPYSREAARESLINPHEQINDEGEVLWSRCLICHRNVPDIEKERSIKDVKLRFSDDLNRLCYSCHFVKKHPGAEGIGPAMSGFVAPNHLVEPSRLVWQNFRLAMKDVYTILPLDPKTGKIFCGTCHNPHERGILYGRANWGADQETRLRSEGLDICQYCHRK